MLEGARTVEPVEPGCARGGSSGICEFRGAGGACTIGGGWDGCDKPTLREARGFSLLREFPEPAGAFGSPTSPVRLRGIVEEYSQTKFNEQFVKTIRW